MGKMLRCRAAATCLHLQLRAGQCGAGSHQPFLCSGGVWWGPASNAKGQWPRKCPLYHTSAVSKVRRESECSGRCYLMSLGGASTGYVSAQLCWGWNSRSRAVSLIFLLFLKQHRPLTHLLCAQNTVDFCCKQRMTETCMSGYTPSIHQVSDTLTKSKGLKQHSYIHLCVLQVKVITKINWMNKDEPLMYQHSPTVVEYRLLCVFIKTPRWPLWSFCALLEGTRPYITDGFFYKKKDIYRGK